MENLTEEKITITKEEYNKLIHPSILEYRGLDSNFGSRFISYFYLFGIYLGIPLIFSLLLKWDPIMGKDEYGDPNKPIGIFLVLFWFYFCYQYRKNRSIVKKLEKYKDDFKL